jgi:hypothetical protein
MVGGTPGRPNWPVLGSRSVRELEFSIHDALNISTDHSRRRHVANRRCR